MTARFLPLICLFGACTREPSAPPARTADLAVPPMPEAGAPPPPARNAAPEEPKPSYEEALATHADAGPVEVGEPDMTDAELSAPMRNAAFISDCGAPDSMRVTVKVAVRRGRAVGVTIRTNPADVAVARCVDDHVRMLSWPVKTKLDSFTTTY